MFFILKTPIKTYVSSGSFLDLGWFEGGFFMFFEVMDWFGEASMIFFRYFWLKIGLKWVSV